MGFAGITAEQVTVSMKANLTDEGVIKWFREAAKPHTPEKQQYFNEPRCAVNPSRTDLTDHHLARYFIVLQN